MSTKYLLFQLPTEWETLVAVVELTPKERENLRKRMDLAESLKEDALAWLQYFDHVDVFEYSDAVEQWIAERDLLDIFEQELKVVCEKEPDYVGWETARVDVSSVHLDGNCCFWEVRLKHADHSLETMPIYRKDLED